ncbi:hypothetical protein BGZ70_006139, partial [Mortierella alpina]
AKIDLLSWKLQQLVIHSTMSSKRVGLPSLNSTSKKDALQPVKVQRYRAGKAPEGYVDPALESSDEEENEGRDPSSARGHGRAGGISMSIGSEPPKMAYQVLNVEQMTRERKLEQAQRKERGGAAAVEPLATAAAGDRRLARLQQMQMGSQRSRGDTRSRRARAGSDDDEEEEDEEEEK